MLDDEGMRGGRCKGFGIVKDANAGHVRYYTEDLQSSVSLLVPRANNASDSDKSREKKLESRVGLPVTLIG